MRLGLWLVMMWASMSVAANRPDAWDNTSLGMGPVVPVYLCEESFATHFGGFPLSNIEFQLRNAVNEWFTTSGANLRLRYMGRYGAKDPHCDRTLPPDLGSIVVHAEHAFGGGGNRACIDAGWGSRTTDAAGQILTGEVILFAGHYGFDQNHVCVIDESTWVPHLWPKDANFPMPLSDEADFWGIFLHEFGHAIGFDHTDLTECPAVMGSGCSGPRRRHLSESDIDGMFFGGIKNYSLGFMQLVGASTFDEGQSWSFPQPANYFSPWLIDRPAAVFVPGSNLNSDGDQQTIVYLDPGSRFLDVIVTNGKFTTYQGTTGVRSTRGPALVLKDETVFMASIADREHVRISRTDDSVTWKDVAVVDIARTSVPPALAWAPQANVLVLAWQHNGGRISIATSADSGISWELLDVIPFEVSDHPFGLTCHTEGGDDWCVLAFPDGQLANTPAGYARFLIHPGAPVQGTLYEVKFFEPTAFLGPIRIFGLPPPDSYGMSVARSNDYLFASRDRGYHTVMSSMRPYWLLGYSTWPMSEPVDYINQPQHSSMSLVWVPESNVHFEWFANGAIYE